MKNTFLFFVFTLISFGLLSQIPFKGGIADGYASATIENVNLSGEEDDILNIKIFPNPSTKNKSIFIESTKEVQKLEIINVYGQLTLKYEGNFFNKKIRIYQEGILFCKLKIGGEYFIRKIIILP